MPRTKAARKKASTAGNVTTVADMKQSMSSLRQSLDKVLQLKLQELKKNQHEEDSAIVKAYLQYTLNLNPALSGKTLGELKKQCLLEVSQVCSNNVQVQDNPENDSVFKEPNVVTCKPKRRSRSCSVKSEQKTTTSSYGAYLSRSTNKSNKKRSTSCDIGGSAKKYITPNKPIPFVGPITPKSDPNVLLPVMRRPRQGETAVSITGSPLMVTGVASEEMASVTVPLRNGQLVTILPTDGRTKALRLDEPTRQQLEILHRNINMCLGRGN